MFCFCLLCLFCYGLFWFRVVVLFSLVLGVLRLIALCYDDVVWFRIHCVAVISDGCLLFAFAYCGGLYVCFVLIACGVGLCY